MGPRLRRLAVPAVLVAALVGMAVAAVAQIGPSSGPYRRTVDRGYAALALPLVAASNRSGVSMRALLTSARTSARSLDRVTLFAQLDQLATDAVAVERAFAAITPPQPATTAASQCRAAFGDRATGAATLRDTLEGVLGGPTGLAPTDQPTAVAGLEAAGSSFAAGDASWASCRRALRKAPGSASLPRSQWVRDPTVFQPPTSPRTVAALTSSRSLAAVHHLVLLGLVTQPTALSTGTTRVVPPTLSLTVDVVVANQGNVDEVGVEVGGTAMPQGAPGSPVPVQRTVDLSAGASTTLGLPAFAVSPGSAYVLQVTAESPRSTGPGPIASTSLPVQVQQATTVTALVATANPAPVGRALTYTADVSASLTGVPKPTGSVVFQDDGVPIPGCSSVVLTNGRALCTTSYQGSALHAVTATYSGNAQLAGSDSGVYAERIGTG
ncbi:MAG TPA: Ig-like domain-containing protein [Acidimicrobiales bacterium]|nr:Ig-like domain-containing protein [Acidimicrobiales bacterium]